MMRYITYKSVHRVVDLGVKIATLVLGKFSGSINETGISRFVGRSQDQRRISGSILQFPLSTFIIRKEHIDGSFTWGL